jgi:DNA-binding NarL/FixJ family response regulator
VAIELDYGEPDRTIVLIGRWAAVPPSDPLVRIEGFSILRCEPRLRAFQLVMTTYEPAWLIMGEGPDDGDRDALVQAGRLICASLRVAVLGADGDLAMAERWLRRGCSAYLSAENSAGRVMSILRFATDTGVCIVDKSFQDASHMRQVSPVASLTRREREVLHLMRLGRRNREIARELVVSGSTVDFHIRNVLEKLGARNRVEAIKRADMLGL